MVYLVVVVAGGGSAVSGIYKSVQSHMADNADRSCWSNGETNIVKLPAN